MLTRRANHISETASLSTVQKQALVVAGMTKVLPPRLTTDSFPTAEGGAEAVRSSLSVCLSEPAPFAADFFGEILPRLLERNPADIFL